MTESLFPFAVLRRYLWFSWAIGLATGFGVGFAIGIGAAS